MMDFEEAIERRDIINTALIILTDEAKDLKMYHAESRIREAGRALLDEVYRLGELGD